MNFGPSSDLKFSSWMWLVKRSVAQVVSVYMVIANSSIGSAKNWHRKRYFFPSWIESLDEEWKEYGDRDPAMQKPQRPGRCLYLQQTPHLYNFTYCVSSSLIRKSMLLWNVVLIYGSALLWELKKCFTEKNGQTLHFPCWSKFVKNFISYQWINVGIPILFGT